MIELNINSILWLCIGVGSTLIIMLMLGLCAVSGRCSRMEERLNTRLKVENWKTTPERLAMTERKKHE